MRLISRVVEPVRATLVGFPLNNVSRVSVTDFACFATVFKRKTQVLFLGRKNVVVLKRFERKLEFSLKVDFFGEKDL